MKTPGVEVGKGGTEVAGPYVLPPHPFLPAYCVLGRSCVLPCVEEMVEKNLGKGWREGQGR